MQHMSQRHINFLLGEWLAVSAQEVGVIDTFLASKVGVSNVWI